MIEDTGRRWRRVGVRTGVLLGAGSLLSALTLGADTCTDITTMVPMRDGVTLATDTWPLKNRTAPTVLFRTPYGRSSMESYSQVYNTNGYAAVSQDIRGLGDSEGIFQMFTHDGWGTAQDGYDTLQWVAAQSWSDGKVGMLGASALSITSILAAGSTPPALSCAYVLVGTGNLYHDVVWWGGVQREEMVVNWLTALGQTQLLDVLAQHNIEDSFWEPIAVQNRYEAVNVPIYSVGGWFDIFSQGNLDLFTGAQSAGGPGARGKQKLYMGPWSHASQGPTVGELTFPDNAILTDWDDQRWFDHCLKGVANGIESEPPVRYYLMGDVDTPSTQWNIWKTTDFWPVPSTPTPYYLLSGGGLATAAPSVSSSSSRYLYDPANPVPTVGGNNLTIPAGSFDQRSVENRPDVLVFSTPILTQPLAIAGRVTARLFIASSAVDTDFTVKLTDVYPDGRSMLMLDGIARTRFRQGFDKEVLMRPGEVVEVEVDLWSTAQVFNAGHQLRVTLSSSNAPRFRVNPNTGAPLAEEDGTLLTAEQTLYHDASHPSRLILPVVPL